MNDTLYTRKQSHLCMYCKKQFVAIYRYGWKSKFCKKECRDSYILKIRRSVDYKNWREACLKRDKYKCHICNSKEKLQVHHKIPLFKDVSKAFNMSNGITLCKKCHMHIHRKLIAYKLRYK